jgi:hypothetical protein
LTTFSREARTVLREETKVLKRRNKSSTTTEEVLRRRNFLEKKKWEFEKRKNICQDDACKEGRRFTK